MILNVIPISIIKIINFMNYFKIQSGVQYLVYGN